MIFWNDHSALCTCFACVMARTDPYTYKQDRGGRVGQPKKLVADPKRAVRMYGSVNKAAKAIGVSVPTLRRRLRETA